MSESTPNVFAIREDPNTTGFEEADLEDAWRIGYVATADYYRTEIKKIINRYEELHSSNLQQCTTAEFTELMTDPRRVVLVTRAPHTRDESNHVNWKFVDRPPFGGNVIVGVGVWTLKRLVSKPLCGTVMEDLVVCPAYDRNDHIKELVRWGKRQAEAYKVKLSLIATEEDKLLYTQLGFVEVETIKLQGNTNDSTQGYEEGFLWYATLVGMEYVPESVKARATAEGSGS
ncbi:MAG: hypothetical protein M4579_000801 [Chaenotheca gracillima]|nr:MAG: hypothetical protein M4579_000801 [Chaenotheca gracillima]